MSHVGDNISNEPNKSGRDGGGKFGTKQCTKHGLDVDSLLPRNWQHGGGCAQSLTSDETDSFEQTTKGAKE